MAKRNREYSDTEESVESTEVIESTETVEETVASDSFKIEDMTDDELIKFMEERKQAKAEAAAIKSVNLPSYILARHKVRPKTSETAALQDQINRLNYELRKKG